jgi:hypothetical protein
MKKISLIFLILVFLLPRNIYSSDHVGTIIDTVRNDTQFIYQYSDCFGSQIYVDNNGNIHR